MSWGYLFKKLKKVGKKKGKTYSANSWLAILVDSFGQPFISLVPLNEVFVPAPDENVPHGKLSLFLPPLYRWHAIFLLATSNDPPSYGLFIFIKTNCIMNHFFSPTNQVIAEDLLTEGTIGLLFLFVIGRPIKAVKDTLDRQGYPNVLCRPNWLIHLDVARVAWQ